jgi:uncharacterized protein YkwD
VVLLANEQKMVVSLGGNVMLRKMAVGFTCFVGVGMLGLLGTSVSVAADKTVPMTFTNSTDGDTDKEAATAKEVLRFVNEERKQRGLAALVEDPALTSAAQKYARFLAQRHNTLVNGPQKLSDADARAQTLSHTLDGKEPFQRAKAAGFPHMDVGEVAHAGPYVNAEQAVRAPDGVGWVNSRGGHREAILSSKYTLAGVGVAFSESGVPYYIMKLASPRQ